MERVRRRPARAACVSAAALIALGLPVLNMHTALPGTGSLPRDIPIMRTYDRIQAAFPGGSSPAVVGVQARAGIARLVTRAGTTPGLLRPITVLQIRDHRVETISIPLAGGGTDARSDAALARLRALVPVSIGR